MKKPFLAIFALAAFSASAQVDFDKYFADSTLRIDYILAGNDKNTAIYLDEVGYTDGWAGRCANLEKPYLAGNGSVTVCDAATGDTIYTNTFSTLFQEWQVTTEASQVSKAFEHTVVVPMPVSPVNITLALTNNRHERVAHLTHRVDPKDILVRHIPTTDTDWKYVHKSGTPADCVDIAIVAEGYTADEKDKFYRDAERAAEALLSHEPFASMSDKFNILAVASVSGDSGPDVPRENLWNRTAHRSHYDTFYSDRYLTTQAIHNIYDAIAGLPVEHIILMVNTPRYGGGGIFNQITVATSDHPTFKEVLVHEFGHAYGGLADEYAYANDNDDTYPLDIEPWEPNITTLVDFDSKWADMMPDGAEIPTSLLDYGSPRDMDLSKKKDREKIHKLTHRIGVFEGAGYRATGVYRPVQECRMKVNEVPDFCPVCTRAIIGITNWYTDSE